MQHCSDFNDCCSNIIYQTVDLNLPITLTPAVDVGKIKMACCGEPRVELCQCGRNNASWEIKITQTVTYKIPIDYSIQPNIGDVISECRKNKLSQ